MYVDMPTGMFFLTIGTASFLGGLASLFLLVKILGLGRLFSRRKTSSTSSSGATTRLSEDDMLYVAATIDKASVALSNLYSDIRSLPDSEIVSSEYPDLQGHEREAALLKIRYAQQDLTAARRYTQEGLRSHAYSSLSDAYREVGKVPLFVGGHPAKTANVVDHYLQRTISEHLGYDGREWDAEVASLLGSRSSKHRRLPGRRSPT